MEQIYRRPEPELPPTGGGKNAPSTQAYPIATTTSTQLAPQSCLAAGMVAGLGSQTSNLDAFPLIRRPRDVTSRAPAWFRAPSPTTTKIRPALNIHLINPVLRLTDLPAA